MVSDRIRQHRIIPTFINSLPRAARMYKTYLPLMPLALEQFDLRGYDLVISSESGPAKGVIPPPEALHVCYCHTPMRYVWNMYHEYRAGAGLAKRLVMPPLIHYLRMWDVSTAARVDSFVANSETVARRIRRYYGADSVVIHPPVDTGAFSIADAVGAWRLLSDGRRTRFVQAAGSRRARIQRDETQAGRDRRRRDAGRDSPDRRPDRHGDGPATVRCTSKPLCEMPRPRYFPARKISEWFRSKPWPAAGPSLLSARAARSRPWRRAQPASFSTNKASRRFRLRSGSLADLSLNSVAIAKHAEQFGRAQFLQKMREHIDGLLAGRRGAR